MIVKLRYKLLLLVLFSTLSSLAFTGFALAWFVQDYRAKATQQNFIDAFRFVAEELGVREARLAGVANHIAEHTDIVSATSLITDYARPERYDPNLFDVEKRNIAEDLGSHVTVSHLSHASLYSASGEMIAFALAGPDGRLTHGIISYQKRKPIVLIAGPGSAAYQPGPLPKEILATFDMPMAARTDIAYRPSEDGLTITGSTSVRRTLPTGGVRQVGTLVVGEHLGATFMEMVSRRTGAQFSIQAPGLAATTPVVITPERLRGAPALDAVADGGLIDDERYFLQARTLPLMVSGTAHLVMALPRSAVEADIRRMQTIIVLIMLISAIVAVPTALWFANRWITRPVRALTHGALQVRDGHYDAAIRLSAGDEFGTVAAAFNDMTATVRQRDRDLRAERASLEERVQERTASLSRLNEDLTGEIERRKTIERALRESRHMLELVMNNIPQAVFWKDRQGAYLGCNAVFARAAGLANQGDIVGKSDRDMPWVRSESDFYIATDRKVMETDTPQLHIIEPIHMADGQRRMLETNKIPLHDGSGAVIGVLGTFEDITERLAAQEALVHAKDEAEKANRAKSDFLSRMSHELRTPLNAILGFSQILETDNNEPLTASQRDSVGEILTAGHHLLAIINDLLDLARIETGQTALSIEEVPLEVAVDNVLTLIRPLAETANIRIEDNSRGRRITVRADATRLKQVLLNLVSNAIKYNHPGGSVEISAEAGEHRARLTVRDTGRGIPAEALPRLFSPFDRLGQERSGIDGIGIGLAITKTLIEAMDGTVGVESEPGKGSSFWVTLPLAIMQG